MTTHILVAAVALYLTVSAIVGASGRWARLRRELAENPDRRSRLYWSIMLRLWIMASVIPIVALTSPELSAAALGWTWPDRNGYLWVAVGLTAYLMVVTGSSARRLRRAILAGRRFPVRAGTELVMPRTPAQRRLAVPFAITAGVVEEAIFRGLLIGAGYHVYHLPWALAALLSLVLFIVGHGYQGRAGLVGVALFGIAFTVIYLITASLLLVIVLHVWQDLVALLVALPSRDSEDETATI